VALYVAETVWTRGDASERDFRAGRYSRRHLLRFDGGAEVAGSASPHNVPLPWSDAAAVDPEEAFVSALSSCHMLFFLSFAARDAFCVDRYVDRADGVCVKDGSGKISMTVVTLRPCIEFSGERRPGRADVERLHHESHEACFIANSVKSEVRCEPVWADPADEAAR
jgi:organic hydroperoxide reductase OsmC/OhrA